MHGSRTIIVVFSSPFQKQGREIGEFGVASCQRAECVTCTPENYQCIDVPEWRENIAIMRRSKRRRVQECEGLSRPCEWRICTQLHQNLCKKLLAAKPLIRASGAVKFCELIRGRMPILTNIRSNREKPVRSTRYQLSMRPTGNGAILWTDVRTGIRANEHKIGPRNLRSAQKVPCFDSIKR